MTRRHGTSHKISEFQRILSYGFSRPAVLQTQIAPTIASKLVDYVDLKMILNGFKFRGGIKTWIQFHSSLSNCRAKSLKILAEFHGKSLMGTGARAFLVEAPWLRNGNGMTLLQHEPWGCNHVQPSTTRGYSLIQCLGFRGFLEMGLAPKYWNFLGMFPSTKSRAMTTSSCCYLFSRSASVLEMTTCIQYD